MAIFAEKRLPVGMKGRAGGTLTGRYCLGCMPQRRRLNDTAAADGHAEGGGIVHDGQLAILPDQQ